MQCLYKIIPFSFDVHAHSGRYRTPGIETLCILLILSNRQMASFSLCPKVIEMLQSTCFSSNGATCVPTSACQSIYSCIQVDTAKLRERQKQIYTNKLPKLMTKYQAMLSSNCLRCDTASGHGHVERVGQSWR